MAYSDFTLPQLKAQFGLTVDELGDLFAATPPVAPPAFLPDLITRFLPLAVTAGEKLRSELVIAPVLAGFKLQHKDRVGLFSGVDFNVDKDAGLVGRCDFLLTRRPSQLTLEGPVCVVVEAKRDDILAGIPQCLAGMVAAQRFNAAAGDPGPLFGIVSSGPLWRFLQLTGTAVVLDGTEYPIQGLPKLFGILSAIAL